MSNHSNNRPSRPGAGSRATPAGNAGSLHAQNRPTTSGRLSLKNSVKLSPEQMWPAFASCPRGLENLLSAELQALGAQQYKPVMGGVEFSATWADLLTMNLWSAIAGRILMRLDHQPCTSETELYRLIKRTPWVDWFRPQQSIRVDLNNLGVELPNARFLQLRVKDAVCDHFRDASGIRPNVDLENPDVRIVVALGPTHASVYIDLSGENLFKRGWRQEKGNAPLKENLAAGIVRLSGWKADTPLLDPFCGSGTILIEAASMATDRAPGLDRRFGFENLRGFDSALWNTLKAQAEQRFEAGLQSAGHLTLQGSDITRLLVEMSDSNARRAGFGPLLDDGRLRFEQRDARTIEPVERVKALVTQRQSEPDSVATIGDGHDIAGSAGTLLCNPPYGERLEAKGARIEQDEAYVQLFEDIGTRLKQQFAGWRFCCLTADLELRKSLGLSPKRKTPLYNGALECRLFEFPLTQGTYRPRSEAG